jgi:hypothetical protein
MEIVPNLQPKWRGLKVWTKGPQPSMFVRTLSLFTINCLAMNTRVLMCSKDETSPCSIDGSGQRVQTLRANGPNFHESLSYAVFRHVRTTAHEFLTSGIYTMMNTKTLSSSEFRSLFSTEGAALSLTFLMACD